MASTAISGLTADTAPDRTADYAPTYDASAATTKKVLLSLLGGYHMHVSTPTFSPADATTYFLSPFAGTVGGASAANNKFYIPRAGLLVRAVIFVVCTTGTGESATVSFRLNDTTDTTISSSVVFNSSPTTITNSSLSVAVATGDFFGVKVAMPTFVTNPTGTFMAVQLWFT